MSVECCLVGVPVQAGTRESGCLMGPDAYRTAGLIAELEQLGHKVQDLGNLHRYDSGEMEHGNASIHSLNEIVGWASAIGDTAYQIAKESQFPIFLGGDHSLSIGSVPGVTKASNEAGKEQFVIWLDAHPDFHTLDTTQSGNLHGTPVA
ncbi:MAG: arginase family protein, partial [Pseudomonadota bacterium]